MNLKILGQYFKKKLNYFKEHFKMTLNIHINIIVSLILGIDITSIVITNHMLIVWQQYTTY